MRSYGKTTFQSLELLNSEDTNMTYLEYVELIKTVWALSIPCVLLYGLYTAEVQDA